MNLMSYNLFCSVRYMGQSNSKVFFSGNFKIESLSLF